MRGDVHRICEQAIVGDSSLDCFNESSYPVGSREIRRRKRCDNVVSDDL